MHDAHSIAPAVRTAIDQRLDAIESESGVCILYACESGSRGWGFASPDSDYDVRFLYVHPPAWYLRVTPGRDVIECPIAGLLDINGWELRKALGLLKKGNAVLAEWLRSPVVYRADAGFLDAIRQAAQRVWQPERAFHHYLHLARGQYRRYLRGETVRLKKYFYVLRPLLAALWIEQGRGVPPMLFSDLVAGVVGDPGLCSAIETLLGRKRCAAELEHGGPIREIHGFVETELSRLEGVPPPSTPDPDFSLLDRLLLETVMKEGRYG